MSKISRTETVEFMEELAIAHRITLSEPQLMAAYDVIGHVDVRDMAAAMPALKFRKGFPFHPEWMLGPIEFQREQRRRQDVERDKPHAAAAHTRIYERISDHERHELMVQFRAQHGTPEPTQEFVPMSPEQIETRKKVLFEQLGTLT